MERRKDDEQKNAEKKRNFSVKFLDYKSFQNIVSLLDLGLE